MKIAFIVPILLLLFIGACQFGGTQQSAVQPVTVDFLQNQPPTDQLFENQNFRVGLSIKNYGSMATSPFVCVYDTLSDFFGGIPQNDCRQIKLNAATKTDSGVTPDTQEVYFPDQTGTYVYKQLSKGMSTNIIADVTYPYETKATSQLCIKRDVSVETPGTTCDLSSAEQVTQDPAPLAITTLQKDVIPRGNNEVTLLLTMGITQQGQGEVIDRGLVGSVGSANQPIGNPLNPNQQIETHLVDVNLNLKGVPLESNFICTPLINNRLVFKENQKTIKCQATFKLDSDFIENPLEISLDYGFRITKSTGQIKLVSNQEAGLA